MRAIQLGGKGFAPAESDPLRKCIKGLSDFVQFLDNLEEVLGETPDPRYTVHAESMICKLPLSFRLTIAYEVTSQISWQRIYYKESMYGGSNIYLLWEPHQNPWQQSWSLHQIHLPHPHSIVQIFIFLPSNPRNDVLTWNLLITFGLLKHVYLCYIKAHFSMSNDKLLLPWYSYRAELSSDLQLLRSPSQSLLLQIVRDVLHHAFGNATKLVLRDCLVIQWFEEWA